jgi:hypothetical protein
MLTAVTVHVTVGMRFLSVLLPVKITWRCNFAVGARASRVPKWQRTSSLWDYVTGLWVVTHYGNPFLG